MSCAPENVAGGKMDGFPPKTLIKSTIKAFYAKVSGQFRTSDILRGTTKFNATMKAGLKPKMDSG